MAVRFFMQHYKHYLLERQFVDRTDDQALKWLYSLWEPKDRIARWLETLSAYLFSISLAIIMEMLMQCPGGVPIHKSVGVHSWKRTS